MEKGRLKSPYNSFESQRKAGADRCVMESVLISAERISKSSQSRKKAGCWKSQRAKHKPILQTPGSKRLGKGSMRSRGTRQTRRAGLVWLLLVWPRATTSRLRACQESFAGLKDSIGQTLCRLPNRCRFSMMLMQHCWENPGLVRRQAI